MKLGTFVGMLSLATLSTHAQASAFWIPSVAIAVLSDDNVFVSSTGREEDVIARVSPGLAAGYESERLLASAAYSQDIESYKDHPELDSSSMRRLLETQLVYRLNEAAIMGLSGSINESRIPAELNISTGAGEGRIDGKRTTINPSFSYRFTPGLSVQIDLTQLRDQLAGGIDGDTRSVDLDVSHTITSRTQLTYAYTYSHYDFDNPEAGVVGLTESVQTPRIGVFHNISEFTSISVQAGPSYSRRETGVNVAFLLQKRYTNGRFSVGYDRGSASLIGEPGLVELDVMNAAVSHSITNRFDVNLSASYGDVSRRQSVLPDTTIYRGNASAIYRINDYVSISASYSVSRQRTTIAQVRSVIPRQVAMLALTLTYPRRDEPVRFVR